MEKNSVSYEKYAEDEIQQWASADYARRTNRPSDLEVYEQSKSQTTHTKPIILLVEDNELIQKINRFYLLSLGCEVILAKTGREAIRMMHDNFDLVILDIGLPDISGIDVAKEIRKSERHGRTPIVALTALSRDIFTPCYAAGMNEVTQKPLPIEEMYTILHRLMPPHQKILENYWLQNRQKP
jgi:CheY-like chemotaxis protein